MFVWSFAFIFKAHSTVILPFLGPIHMGRQGVVKTGDGALVLLPHKCPPKEGHAAVQDSTSADHDSFW